MREVSWLSLGVGCFQFCDWFLCLLLPDIGQAHNSSKRILKARELTFIDGTQIPKPAEHGCEIEFRSVDFKYPSRDNPVFENLNLKIQAGQFAAFVGASGSGKTTGISLIERFYDVTGGQILVDGVSLIDYNRVEYRKLISLVPQEPTLYQGMFIVCFLATACCLLCSGGRFPA